MRHAVHHDLDMETSRRVTDKAWSSYRERFSNYRPTIDWTSETKAKVGFQAKGLTLNGELELLEGQIAMDLTVPFLLKPFRKVALDVIESEIKKWVAKAKTGSL